MERFEPRVEASERRVLEAEFRLVSTLLVAALSMKSVPCTRPARPRPFELKVTPVMLRLDLPVSSNTSLSWSPFSRLTPLNEASSEVVSICVRMLLYWDTRLVRVAWATASATGEVAFDHVSADVSVPPMVPPAAADPIVEEA